MNSSKNRLLLSYLNNMYLCRLLSFNLFIKSFLYKRKTIIYILLFPLKQDMLCALVDESVLYPKAD